MLKKRCLRTPLSQMLTPYALSQNCLQRSISTLTKTRYLRTPLSTKLTNYPKIKYLIKKYQRHFSMSILTKNAAEELHLVKIDSLLMQ